MSRTLLEAAARDDRLLLEKALSSEFGYLEHDDINQALMRAAQNGNKECVERLVAEGAEIDCDDSDGDTPLMLAAANDNIGVVRLLLQYGCNVDKQSDRDRSALHMAVWNKCMRIIDLLIDIGCDINLQERYGDTPVMLAARRGYPEAIRRLLQREDCEINTRSYEKDTALHYAARHGHPDCLRLIMSKNPDLEPGTLWGHTPLLFAAMNGHDECAKLLLDVGANYNVTDRSLKSTLHYFAMKNSVENIKYIMKKGVHPNLVDSDGITPLFEAVLQGNVETVHVLIQHGANVHGVGKCTIKGKYGFCTCLELALHRGDLKIARILAAAGATAKDLEIFCYSYPDIIFDERVCLWIREFLSDPFSLQALCRCSIRDYLKNTLIYKTHNLPLPKSLKSFIAFDDLLKE